MTAPPPVSAPSKPRILPLPSPKRAFYFRKLKEIQRASKNALFKCCLAFFNCFGPKLHNSGIVYILHLKKLFDSYQHVTVLSN
jgi:hypothetical protein